MRRFRNEHDTPRRRLAARFDRRPDRHHAAQLAVRARLRRHRDRGHAGHRLQRVGKRFDQLERALRCRYRLKRMDVGETGSRAIFSLRRGLCFIVHEPSG